MPTLRAADMSNRRTFEANHNAAPVAEILGRFRTSRMRFVQKLEQLDEAFLVSSALHRRLRTPMRVIDMVYFVAEHDDHHLAAAHRIAVTLK